MKHGFNIPSSLLLLTLGLIILPVTMADMTYVQQQTITTSGQKPLEVTVTTYITSSKMKTEKSDGTSTIIDLDEMKLIEIDRIARKYDAVDLKVWAEQMKSAPGFSEFKTKITVGKKTRTIAGYICRPVVSKMGPTKQVSWVTSDIAIDPEITEFNKKLAETFPDVPLITAKYELWQQYLKLKSFPVQLRIDMKVKVGKSSITSKTKALLKTHNYNKIAPETFNVPKGYTRLKKTAR